MIPDRARRVLIASSCALSFAACTVLPAPDPVDVYLLPAVAVAPAEKDAKPRPWSLRVARPEASGQLIGQRILVVPEANRMSVYKGASWHEPAPLLVRDRVLDAFRTDGRVTALSTDEMRTFSDFELASDLSGFHSEYRQHGKPPEAVVRLDMRLIDASSRRIVASRVFEARQAAADKSIASVVTAFGLAADRLVGELVAWTVTQADAAHRDTAAEAIPVSPP